MRSLAGLIVGPSVPGARGQAYPYVLKHVFLFHLVPHQFHFWPKLPQNPASVWMLWNSFDWLLPKVFPNNTVRWSPLLSSSRAWARPARWLFLQPFPKKYFAEKVPARLRADILLSQRLSVQVLARSGMVFGKVFYLKEVTDTWISALPTYVRGFPEEQTCSLY